MRDSTFLGGRGAKCLRCTEWFEWGMQHRQWQDTGSKSSKWVSILWVTFHHPEEAALFLEGEGNNYFDDQGGMI